MTWDAFTAIALRVLGVVVLVLLNAFFVAAEFSLVKVRDTQLSPLVRRGQRRAQVAEYIVHRLDSFLSAAQLGITLTSLGLGWIGKPVFALLLQPVFALLNVESQEVRTLLAFVVGFSVITFLHISAGEQAPKWMAIQKPLPSALAVALPLHWFYRIAYPFIWILNSASLWLLRRLGIEPEQQAELLQSEEEL